MDILQDDEDAPPKFNPPTIVHCEGCQGGCGCGYDSSEGGFCPCDNACECPTCSPERKSRYTLFMEPSLVSRRKREEEERAARTEGRNASE